MTKISNADLAEDTSELIIATTALRVEALERQIAMLGAAVGEIQANIADPQLNAQIEQAMLAAGDRVRAEQQEAD